VQTCALPIAWRTPMPYHPAAAATRSAPRKRLARTVTGAAVAAISHPSSSGALTGAAVVTATRRACFCWRGCVYNEPVRRVARILSRESEGVMRARIRRCGAVLVLAALIVSGCQSFVRPGEMRTEEQTVEL